MDSSYSYTPRLYCFHVLISDTGDVHTRTISARPAAAEASFPKGNIKEVSCAQLFTCIGRLDSI